MVFKEEQGLDYTEMEIPCGKCIGCRLEKSRQWALRCVHEASLYDKNCFITLTYRPEDLPPTGSLIKQDFQKFMKRLRKRFPGTRIRYFMCGEYGTDDDQPSRLGRPHYHACLFNFDFDDRELYSVRDNIRLYTSETLDKIWGKGFCTIGDVTFDSAAYVARYVMKKITGEQAENHYQKINYGTGEINEVIPEYITMSRRPGIGREWFNQFKNDLKKDFITHNGVKMKPPKYYDAIFDQEDPDHYDQVKEKRRLEGEKQKEDNAFPRNYVKREIKERQIKRLERNLD